MKDAEANGYTYEAADASFELLLLEELNGQRTQYFTVESWRAIVERRGPRRDAGHRRGDRQAHRGWRTHRQHR